MLHASHQPLVEATSMKSFLARSCA